MHLLGKEFDTTTPIKHLVIIFQENVSFDHYFATYPVAKNPPGEPNFQASKNTGSVNGLTASLLFNNSNAINPFRLGRNQADTCSNIHSYTALQSAYHAGLLDKFVENTGPSFNEYPIKRYCDPHQTMGYFDGNTVTALWNYAQHFAISDNFFSSVFGPSTPAAINLIAGQTHGAIPAKIKDNVINGTVIGNPIPMYDDCAGKGLAIYMTGKNIGDLLNSKGITWGWFSGGFMTHTRSPNGTAICDSSHVNLSGHRVFDYSAVTQPFQYYKSTANKHHLPPTSPDMIGQTDQANHQYDLRHFWQAAQMGKLPSLSFLKAPRYQDGHPGYSNPLDEQDFLVNTINSLQKLPFWNSTAVIISYDDSDGWYDHVMPQVIIQSSDKIYDRLLGPYSLCGEIEPSQFQDRCGYGPRVPTLAISPWSKANYVDHRVNDHASILRFIEDNWKTGRIGHQSLDSIAGSILHMFDFTNAPRKDVLLMDPKTGFVFFKGIK